VPPCDIISGMGWQYYAELDQEAKEQEARKVPMSEELAIYQATPADDKANTADVTPVWKTLPEESNEYRLQIVDPDGWYKAAIKWDGCIDLDTYANTPLTHRKPDEEDACDCYIHICDVDDFIGRLQSLKALALAHFDGLWPRR
jgi:hypothetical protein